MDTHDTEVVPPPQPAPQQPPYRPLLRRSTGDKVIAGVCGGLGRRYGVDPSVIRVGFVVAILAGGIGLFSYLALWLLLPTDTDREPDLFTRSLGRLIAGSVVAVISVLAFFGWLRSLGGLSGLIVGGFLVGLAVWLYSRRDSRATSPAVPVDPQRAPQAGFAYGGTGTAGEPAATTDTPPFGYPEAPAAPVAPRETSYLGLVVVLAAFMAAGLMAALAASGLVAVSAVVALAVVLAILGAGLVVAAFFGRARWLIIPALLVAMLIPPVALLSQRLPEIRGAVDSGVGERLWTPLADGADYELGIGSATLDLTDWAEDPTVAPPEEGDRISASVDLGELTVIVPASWQVRVDATADVGEIVVNGRRPGTRDDAGDNSSSGVAGATFDSVLRPVGRQTGSLKLQLEVGAGQIALTRAPTTAVPEREEPATGQSDGPARDRREQTPRDNNPGRGGTGDGANRTNNQGSQR